MYFKSDKETLAPVSSCDLMVSELWNSSLVEALVLSEDFEVMWRILKSSSSGLSILKKGSGFSVTKESNESNGSKESTET